MASSTRTLRPRRPASTEAADRPAPWTGPSRILDGKASPSTMGLDEKELRTCPACACLRIGRERRPNPATRRPAGLARYEIARQRKLPHRGAPSTPAAPARPRRPASRARLQGDRQRFDRGQARHVAPVFDVGDGLPGHLRSGPQRLHVSFVLPGRQQDERAAQRRQEGPRSRPRRHPPAASPVWPRPRASSAGRPPRRGCHRPASKARPPGPGPSFRRCRPR